MKEYGTKPILGWSIESQNQISLLMNNIFPQDYNISAEDRSQLKQHEAFVIWFTGLSGSGKSTIANAVEKELFKEKIHTYALDGDNIRKGLNKDLGFSEEERTENMRRIAEVAKLFVDSGTVVLAAFITPLDSDRQLTKDIIGAEKFIEVYVATSLQECERRDVKGLYKKARTGEIQNFTGITAPFEPPVNPHLRIDTEKEEVKEAVRKILEFIGPKLKKLKK